MKEKLKTIPEAFRIVFTKINYKLLGIVLSLFFILFYISIPVFSVPGNNYEFFISSTSGLEIGLIIFLSILVGVVTTMQIYAWKNGEKSKTNAALGTTGFFSGAIASVFSTATCASCVSAIFSFLGIGGVIFLIEHKIEIIAASSIIVIFALFLISEKITNGCKSCKI